MSYKLSQLYLNDPRYSQYLVEALIEQPDTPEQNSSFFVLLEIFGNSADDKTFLQNFLEVAYQAWQESYLNQPEQALENILKSLNDQLVIKYKNYGWPKKLNACVGILTEKQLYFAIYGKIKVYLIKPQTIRDAAGRAGLPENNLIFDSMYSGELKVNDRLLITTPSLTDYLSLEKIKKIAGTLPPAGAIAHFNNMLEAASPSVSFLAMLLQMTAEPSTGSATNFNALAVRQNKASAGSKNSLDQLFKTQADTEKILTPPTIWEIVRETGSIWLKKIKGLPRLNAKPEESTAKNLLIQDKLPKNLLSTQTALKTYPNSELNETAPFRETAKTVLKRPTTNSKNKYLAKSKFLVIGGKILKQAYLLISKILAFIFDEKTRRSLIITVDRFLKLIINKFRHLSKKNRIAIFALLGVLLILSQGLIWQQRRVAARQEEKTIKEITVQTLEKYNTISASLIYRDAGRARQLLAEIKTLIDAYPAGNKKRMAERDQLKKEYDNFFTTVWKLTEILEPLMLVDFQAILPLGNLNKIALNNGWLYGFGDSNQAAAFKTANNSTVLLDQLNMEIRQAVVNPATGNLILIDSQNQFYTLKQNEITPISVKPPAELKQVDAVNFYNGRIYLLDRGAKQIFRLTQYGASFASPTPWVKEDLPLNEAVGLTIDAYVYVLKQNGELLKLAAGKQDGSAIILNVEPVLSSSTVLYANEKTKNLYILEPANKRFLVFSKEGELTRQYHSESFDNLKDIIIDEAGGQAYLLNGAKVYVINIK